jgi:16S rRNA (guanine966-N2)-methyltransferase
MRDTDYRPARQHHDHASERRIGTVSISGVNAAISKGAVSSLRVIAGKARGRRLRSVPGDSTRPITDRAKESLFNIIGGDIQGASFLDLFAGTGSVGIEALSRGAAFTRFIDHQRQAVETVRYNLQATGFGEAAEVTRMDAFSMLERAADRAFDYIFIAPPQYKGLWKKALIALDENPTWLSKDAWGIVQIHPAENENIVMQNLIEFDQRQYGSVLFKFYETTSRSP